MIGIIANPASGKDIRRLVSYATVVDNNEKVNIVKRIVLAAQSSGVSTIYIMPDTYRIGLRVIEDLSLEKRLRGDIRLLEMKVEGSQEDSTKAAAMMRELQVKCIVVLGGDGTSRAVAKGIGDVPILPLSTGTNNVYPAMLEGTVAGMAAAAVAGGFYDREARGDKRIELWRDGRLVDIALVDAVISTSQYVGSRAIWQKDCLRRVITTFCHPASIGFSALMGCQRIVGQEEDYGLCADLGTTEHRLLAPIAAGILEEIQMSEPEVWKLEQPYEYRVKENGMLALDGEREIELTAGEVITFRITRKGPHRIEARAVLEKAQAKGFFHGLAVK